VVSLACLPPGLRLRPPAGQPAVSTRLTVVLSSGRWSRGSRNRRSAPAAGTWHTC